MKETAKFRKLWPYLSSHDPDDYNLCAHDVYTSDGERIWITSMPDVPGYWAYDESGMCIEDDPFDTVEEAIDYVKNN